MRKMIVGVFILTPTLFVLTSGTSNAEEMGRLMKGIGTLYAAEHYGYAICIMIFLVGLMTVVEKYAIFLGFSTLKIKHYSKEILQEAPAISIQFGNALTSTSLLVGIHQLIDGQGLKAAGWVVGAALLFILLSVYAAFALILVEVETQDGETSANKSGLPATKSPSAPHQEGDEQTERSRTGHVTQGPNKSDG
jgi:hypothetical protein